MNFSSIEQIKREFFPSMFEKEINKKLEEINENMKTNKRIQNKINLLLKIFFNTKEINLIQTENILWFNASFTRYFIIFTNKNYELNYQKKFDNLIYKE